MRQGNWRKALKFLGIAPLLIAQGDKSKAGIKPIGVMDGLSCLVRVVYWIVIDPAHA